MKLVNILFRDVLGITVVIFVAIVAMSQIQQQESQASSEMPGSLMAAISWPEGDIDVDLWMDGPGEPVPVGYSNKGGVIWNLLRDDLGRYPDFMAANFENGYTRGLPPGEYRLNVQCFRCPKLPVEVKLEVKQRDEAGERTVAHSLITMRMEKEEKTGIAFRVDADGKVVKDSLNTVFQPLRSGEKQ